MPTPSELEARTQLVVSQISIRNNLLIDRLAHRIARLELLMEKNQGNTETPSTKELTSLQKRAQQYTLVYGSYVPVDHIERYSGLNIRETYINAVIEEQTEILRELNHFIASQDSQGIHVSANVLRDFKAWIEAKNYEP